jgi:tetrahydromethanopterin S-methyltransferase subunit F
MDGVEEYRLRARELARRLREKREGLLIAFIQGLLIGLVVGMLFSEILLLG